VSLTGRVAIEGDKASVDEQGFPGRQGRIVFAYLLAEPGRLVPRDELAEALWGETLPATWEKALAVLMSKLRGLLDACGVDGSAALTSAFGCYRLALPDGSWIDAAAAAESVQEAEAALAGGRADDARAEAAAAAALARRTFLPGEDGPWVEAKRAELGELLVRALACLAEAELGAGNAAGAAHHAEELTTLEPFRESGYRLLMRAHAAAGNPAEALRVYEHCRRTLDEELGTYPSAETETVYLEILRARPAASAEAADTEPRAPLAPGGNGRRVDAEPATARGPRRAARLAAAAVIGAAALAAALALTLGRSASAPARIDANSAGELAAGGNRLVAQVRVGSGPGPIATGADSLWIANGLDDTVSRVDPSTDTVRQTIAVNLDPTALAFGHGALWVACSGTRSLLWINPETYALLRRIRVGNGPSAVALSPGREWVANRLDDTVTEISAAGRVLRTLDAGASPSDIAYGYGALWIANESTSTVTRLDPRTGELETIAVGNGPSAIAVGDGSVWVANALDGTVSRIDPTRDAIVATVAVGDGPASVLVDGDNVWVANGYDGTLSRIDAKTTRVVATVPVGNAPQGLASIGGRLWLSARGGTSSHRGGTLRLVAPGDAVGVVDPAVAYAPAEWSVLAVLGDGLVGFKRVAGLDGGTLEPDLATSLPVPTDGGRTYTFRIRRGIRYSDGEPVRASDLRRALERDFRSGSPGTAYYTNIVGGDACSTSRCDLSKGVVADDVQGVVTLHLRHPDPELLYKLALPFAYLVPQSAPPKPLGRKGIPGTGPYLIERHTASQLVLVRNPHFHEWSAAAQPDGYADRIVWTLSGTADQQTTAVERGEADLLQHPPLNRLGELATRYTAQLHAFPLPGTFGLFLNTRLAPFDELAVRRALNDAIDRRKVSAAFGGPESGSVTCQILPVGTPGYRPRCPYTQHPGSSQSAPNLGLARRLVARSGTRGESVAVYAPSPPQPGQLALAQLGVAALDRLGYRAYVKRVPHDVYFQTVMDPRTRAQAGFIGEFTDYPAASDMLSGFTCRAAASGNPSGSQLCNRGLDRAVAGALAAQTAELPSARTAWARVDDMATALAPWVPLANPREVVLVSRRLGNVQVHTVFGPLIAQLWVR
jgi:peptide/nickel transport system substrate-binding protein